MLTAADKQRLVDAMLTGVPDDPVVVREMATYAWNDVAYMEPILEEILRRERDKAFAQGQLQVWLELAYEAQTKDVAA